MKKNIAILMSLLLFAAFANAQKLTRPQYIEKFKYIAVRQMQTYGVPASIILAQACLESNDGNSTLAREGHNHFGIKCAGWMGQKMYQDDDQRNECFRVYDSDEASFIDHSDFLRYRKRYASLFDLNRTDYKGWAKGLKAAGYATDSRYADRLIQIIEQYQLYKYDTAQTDYVVGGNSATPNYTDNVTTTTETYTQPSNTNVVVSEPMTKKELKKLEKERKKEQKRLEKERKNATSVKTDVPKSTYKPTKQTTTVSTTPIYDPSPIEPVKTPSEAMRQYDRQNVNIDNFVINVNRTVNIRNGIKYVIAKYNDTYERIADEFKISANQLRHFNDDNKNAQPKEGDMVYLALKKSKAGADFPMHVAEEGETLRSVSQQYGVRLKDLCKKNGTTDNETLHAGQTIYLRNEMSK